MPAHGFRCPIIPPLVPSLSYERILKHSMGIGIFTYALSICPVILICISLFPVWNRFSLYSSCHRRHVNVTRSEITSNSSVCSAACSDSKQKLQSSTSLFRFTYKLIQSLFLQWFVKLMGPSLFSFIVLIVFFFLRLIITCRLWVIYVKEDNYSNVKVMIARLIWTIWTPMSYVPKKADNLISLSPHHWPFARGIHRDRSISISNVQSCGKRFHSMTSFR